MHLDALGKQPLAAMSPTTVENGTTALGLHPGAESELPLARPLGRLIGAFHKSKNRKEPKSIPVPRRPVKIRHRKMRCEIVNSGFQKNDAKSSKQFDVREKHNEVSGPNPKTPKRRIN